MDAYSRCGLEEHAVGILKIILAPTCAYAFCP